MFGTACPVSVRQCPSHPNPTRDCHHVVNGVCNAVIHPRGSDKIRGTYTNSQTRAVCCTSTSPGVSKRYPGRLSHQEPGTPHVSRTVAPEQGNQHHSPSEPTLASPSS